MSLCLSSEKGSDFDGEPVVMYFDPCQDRFCVNISIYDDEIVEQDEEFLMIIDPIELDNRISLTPNNATVTITDMGGSKYGIWVRWGQSVVNIASSHSGYCETDGDRVHS